jgi:hypothetical protein
MSPRLAFAKPLDLLPVTGPELTNEKGDQVGRLFCLLFACPSRLSL